MSETAAPLDDQALDQLFRAARTQNKWQDRPVPDAKLHELYDLLKWGPTSANSSPARFVFVRTAEGKAKLKEALSAGNTEKTMTAPVTAIVCYDSYFYDKLGQLFRMRMPSRGSHPARNSRKKPRFAMGRCRVLI